MQVSPLGGRTARALLGVARLAFFVGAAAVTAVVSWVLTYGPTLPLPERAPAWAGGVPLPPGAYPVAPPRPSRAPLPPGTYPAGPLRTGEAAPLFESAGWLNGPPPSPGSHGPRLIVVDVWSDW